MTRRGFLGFFMLGGLMGFVRQRLARVLPASPRKASFWKKVD